MEIARKVSFRGPDSCRVNLYNEELTASVQGNNAVFFNRLAIIDLDPRSDQPFEDDWYTLLFNGEIYNYQELKTILQRDGYFLKQLLIRKSCSMHCKNGGRMHWED